MAGVYAGVLKVHGDMRSSVVFNVEHVEIRSGPGDDTRTAFEPELVSFPLDEAFIDGEPNLFSLLRWDYRLVETLYGREAELVTILDWARGGSNTPTARLITGEGGTGKTRLAAAAAEALRREGWSAGFLRADQDLQVRVGPLGLFLIVDYPEEQPERTAAILARLAATKTAPYRVRVVLLSRRGFAEWESQAAALQGRFGRQALAEAGPLSVRQAEALIAEASQRFAAQAGAAMPDLAGARAWLAASDRHRLPLYATAAAVHAALSPRDAFGLGSADLLRQLAAREEGRVRKTSSALGLGGDGLGRLLGLGVLADGLAEAAVRDLAGAGVCDVGSAGALVTAVSGTPWWKAGRLRRLEPDAPAAAFLDAVLFGPAFPRGRAELPDWLFAALRGSGEAFGARLGRVAYDLALLHPDQSGEHPLMDALGRMLAADPARAEPFRGLMFRDTPLFAARFAARACAALADRERDLPMKAALRDSQAGNLAKAGQHGEALAAMKEAVDLYAELAGREPGQYLPNYARALANYSGKLFALGRDEAAAQAAEEAISLHQMMDKISPGLFDSNHANALSTLSGCLSALGRHEPALSAMQASVSLYEKLARSDEARHRPKLAMSLVNLSGKLHRVDRDREAEVAARRAVNIRRPLANVQPEAFRSALASSLNQLGTVLNALEERDEAAACLDEAVAINRDLVRTLPEAGLPDLAASLNNLGLVLASLERWPEAVRAHGEAASIFRALSAGGSGRFDIDSARALRNLAIGLPHIEDGAGPAVAAARESVAFCQNSSAEAPAVFEAELATSLHVLSHRAAEVGDRGSALDALRSMVEVGRSLAARAPENVAGLATALSDLATFARGLPVPDGPGEALAAGREALGLWTGLAEGDPNRYLGTALRMSGLVIDLLLANGQAEAAIAAARGVRDLCERAEAPGEGERASLFVAAASDLGRLLASQGRLLEAATALRPAAARVLEMPEEARRVQGPRLADVFEGLVRALSGAGEAEAAVEVAGWSVAVRESAMASEPAAAPELAGALHDLAVALLVAARFAEASDAASRSIALQQSACTHLPEAESRLADTRRLSAAIRSAQDRREIPPEAGARG